MKRIKKNSPTHLVVDKELSRIRATYLKDMDPKIIEVIEGLGDLVMGLEFCDLPRVVKYLQIYVVLGLRRHFHKWLVADKLGIGRGCVYRWLRDFGLGDDIKVQAVRIDSRVGYAGTD